MVQGQGDGATQPATPGRPAVTSRAELEQISLAMFSEQGFDVTSVDEIAAAAGIGRRTFFRYFKSKNDAVWGEFDAQLDSLCARGSPPCPPDVPVVERDPRGRHRLQFLRRRGHRIAAQPDAVILSSPALQAYSTLRYAAWRDVVARFAATGSAATPMT